MKAIIHDLGTEQNMRLRAAADLVICADGRYGIRKVQPVDMFPQSGGIETVVKLEKRKS